MEGLALIVKEVPKLLPLSDQHLLAFLSEILKMSSVADGEMTDNTLASVVVDKNGFVASSFDPNSDVYPSHASSLFHRRECVVNMNGIKFAIPEESPVGVQLRVASISLIHMVIRHYTDAFFDAEATTPIGTYDVVVVANEHRLANHAVEQGTFGRMSSVSYSGH